MENNKKYCIWCGTAYEGEIQLCPGCKKNPLPQENLLVDFLVSHTKSKFKSNTESTLYDAVKNWALSHLYGVVLAVTVVATAVTVSASDLQRHIKNVDSRPGYTARDTNSSSQTQNPALSYIVTAQDKEEFSRIIDTVYSSALENCGGVITDEIRNLWVPESIAPNRIHHSFKDRWGDDLYNNMHTLTSCRCKFDGTVYRDLRTTTAIKLQAEGYPVAFIHMDMDLRADDGQFFYPDYYVTMVKINGSWFILEELNTHSRWSEVKDIWVDP